VSTSSSITIEMSQPLISQHLRVLRSARVVARARGRESVYTLVDQHVGTLSPTPCATPTRSRETARQGRSQKSTRRQKSTREGGTEPRRRAVRRKARARACSTSCTSSRSTAAPDGPALHAGRRAIIALLATAVTRSVSPRSPAVSRSARSSAYRNLVDLESAGWCAGSWPMTTSPVRVGGGSHRAPHHLLCVACGKVTDVTLAARVERN